MKKIFNSSSFVLLISMFFIFNAWGQISNPSYPLQSSLNTKLEQTKVPLIKLEDIDLEKVTAEDLIEDAKNEKAT